MNNLFKLISKNQIEDQTLFEVVFSDETHPVFQAHFPGNSLLPGFLHIDTIAILLNTKIKKIKKAKFIAPIFPNDTVIFQVNNKKDAYVVKVLKNNKKCSEFTFE